MKTTYYVAASIDGYIARKDGDVSWLKELDISMGDAGYNTFYSRVDALVMGRKTYEMIVALLLEPIELSPYLKIFQLVNHSNSR